MSKHIRTIYLYIVAFITLCMIVFGIVFAVNNMASYYFPTVYYYMDYDDYNNSQQGYEKELLKEKRRNVKSMISSLTVTLIGIPLYMYHWKTILKEESKEE